VAAGEISQAQTQVIALEGPPSTVRGMPTDPLTPSLTEADIAAAAALVKGLAPRLSPRLVGELVDALAPAAVAARRESLPEAA
jgi:hypothetical protein